MSLTHDNIPPRPFIPYSTGEQPEQWATLYEWADEQLEDATGEVEQLELERNELEATLARVRGQCAFLQAQLTQERNENGKR